MLHVVPVTQFSPCGMLKHASQPGPSTRSAQVLVATGDGGTDRLYRFPRFLLPSAHHMCLFEHVEGCRFCETLFGHYLLPSGALAHFYLGDTVVKVRIKVVSSIPSWNAGEFRSGSCRRPLCICCSGHRYPQGTQVHGSTDSRF